MPDGFDLRRTEKHPGGGRRRPMLSPRAKSVTMKEPHRQLWLVVRRRNQSGGVRRSQRRRKGLSSWLRGRMRRRRISGSWRPTACRSAASTPGLGFRSNSHSWSKTKRGGELRLFVSRRCESAARRALSRTRVLARSKPMCSSPTVRNCPSIVAGRPQRPAPRQSFARRVDCARNLLTFADAYRARVGRRSEIFPQSLSKRLIELALPRGIEPLFSP